VAVLKRQKTRQVIFFLFFSYFLEKPPPAFTLQDPQMKSNIQSAIAFPDLPLTLHSAVIFDSPFSFENLFFNSKKILNRIQIPFNRPL